MCGWHVNVKLNSFMGVFVYAINIAALVLCSFILYTVIVSSNEILQNKDYPDCVVTCTSATRRNKTCKLSTGNCKRGAENYEPTNSNFHIFNMRYPKEETVIKKCRLRGCRWWLDGKSHGVLNNPFVKMNFSSSL